ncbi:uncharacterized protein MELLADRAFT_64984 [Melampsora larici-populina 98AG31]|uniref:Uncharacterized protein n=1 Tax=Melampsora larici-populina (strain 98AG31 / pathotype 3-4-7) TaxID=747676 RepID=F4RTJ0_MELLP|nr:uncharacterized protein MELLADRAFT_64984 [Melampsora larici-populina 98AG31]EGG04263.1 hypothetical protein MELLADRAFT_64984 [Melampsora larici-populina 98AG31]
MDSPKPPTPTSNNGDGSNRDVDPSWNTELPPPPPGVFKTRDELDDHVHEHALLHGYKISCLDSCPTFVDFKCSKGATRHANSQGTYLVNSLKKLDSSTQTSLIQTFQKAINDAQHSSVNSSPKTDLEEEDDYEIQMQLTPHSKSSKGSQKLKLEEDEEPTPPRKRLCKASDSGTLSIDPELSIKPAKAQIEQHHSAINTTKEHVNQPTKEIEFENVIPNEQPADNVITGPIDNHANTQLVTSTGSDRSSSNLSSPFPTPSIPELDVSSIKPVTTIIKQEHASISSPLPPTSLSGLVSSSKNPRPPISTLNTNNQQVAHEQEQDKMKPPLTNQNRAKPKGRNKNTPVPPTRKSTRINRHQSPVHEEPVVVKPVRKIVQGTSKEAVQGTSKKVVQGASKKVVRGAGKKVVQGTSKKSLPSNPHEPEPTDADEAQNVKESTPEEDSLLEMAVELVSRYDWYFEHLPELCPGYNFDKFMEILQNPLATATRQNWYPMPGGSALIANTFHQPVMYYTPAEALACTTYPFFTAPPPEINPIIIAFVFNDHYVSLELNFSDDLPIPNLCSEWSQLHDNAADTWTGMYEENFLVFKNIAKEIRTERNKRRDETDGPSQCVTIDISSPLTSPSPSSSSRSSSSSSSSSSDPDFS